jgi:phosphatidylserine/phosphatidylglycerophosphate/cardiolipin synthase-like enzyme
MQTMREGTRRIDDGKEEVLVRCLYRMWLVGGIALCLAACAQSRPAFLPSPTSTPHSPVAAVSDVSLAIEPSDGIRWLTRAIDHAQRTIFVETYILSDNRIIHALERAEAQGVDVYVILERHPFGLASQPGKVEAELAATGVSVRWAPPGFQFMHAKYLVLDDQLALISTANLSRAAFAKNREFFVEIRIPREVHEISNLFRRDWDRLPEQSADPALLISPLSARSKLEALIRRAQRSIDIYAEEIGDPAIERLLDAKARQGLRVRLLLPLGSSRTAAIALMRHEVHVATLVNPYIHAKVLLEDSSTAYVGSINLSTTSLDYNRELGILLNGNAVKLLQSTFERDWAKASPE